MAWDFVWDYEADVVCTDAGATGLAGAISAVDNGATVFVAGLPPVPSGDARTASRSWFTLHGDDVDTAAYLKSLTDDLDPANLFPLDEALPIRQTSAPEAQSGRQRVPPFVGSRLRDWAARCISSPSGYLYTRVTDWNSTAMESGDGEAVEVSDVGSMTPDPAEPVSSVLGWLVGEARDRGVVTDPVTGFERLVLDDGVVAGAVFTTPDGPLAVRARHGVLICRAGLATTDKLNLDDAGSASLGVGLVSKVGSRFGRLELLTSVLEPARARR